MFAIFALAIAGRMDKYMGNEPYIEELKYEIEILKNQRDTLLINAVNPYYMDKRFEAACHALQGIIQTDLNNDRRNDMKIMVQKAYRFADLLLEYENQ